MTGSAPMLTGRDAAMAVGALMRLGNSGARFDGRRVLGAVRTRAGRALVLTALRRALAPREPARLAATREAGPRPRARQRAPRRVATPARPGRGA